MSVERIAILGGGASGTLLAAELLRQARGPLEVLLLEPRAALGRGPAYTTPFPVHLMNVPAERLSARPDEPDHFLAWLRKRHPARGAGRFVERRLYGAYLEEVVAEARAEARASVSLAHVQAEVVDVRPADGRFEVVIAHGAPLGADRVVLALGNLGPDTLARLAPWGRDPVRYVRDPWAPGALDFPEPEGGVLVLGTGLTAVDVVLGLRHRGHAGRVVAVSRHGLLPRVHSDPPGAAGHVALTWDLAAPPTLRRLVQEFRRQLARALAEGGDFRVVVDSLRPRTQSLWRALRHADRARFVRHLQPYWDVHRHRMAPAAATSLQGLLATGALSVLAGSVENLEERSGVLRARIRRRGAPEAAQAEFRHAVDATGPAPLRRTAHPLLSRMLAQGLVRTDALGLGLDATADGRIVSVANPRGDRLFAMGPLLKGTLWETTAMAEIRAQARDLARSLVGLASPPREDPRARRSVRPWRSP